LIINSGQAETIINILIDINGFWAYENRELQLIEIQEEAEV
jgi:serine/threonine-protein phosphatase 2A regulatory subunit B''